MIKHEKTEQLFNRLRKQAEDLICLESGDVPVSPQSEIMELIHELHIHQVELEIQNEELKRAQSEISLLHKEYADLYEFAPSGYITLNPKGIITHCNLASVMILGMDRTQLIGYGLSRFISLESRNDYYSALKRSEENQDKVTAEVKVVKPGGGPVWLLMEIQADFSGENQLIQKRLVFINIDRQKQVEEQLTKREERLALAIRAARLGIWDWDIKKNEMVWDQGMYDLHGLERGVTPMSYEVWLNSLHPDDRDENKSLSEAAKRGEKEYDTEFRILLPDGAIRYVKAMGQVIWDKKSHPERMTGVNCDITASKKAEMELRESEEKYRVLFDTFPLGITISDSSGKIVETNSTAENLLGVPKKQHETRHLSGKEWRIIRPDGSIMPDHEFASVRALNEKRRIENVEMGMMKPDHDDIAWLSVTAEPIKLENYGVVVAYADITERKKAEESVFNMEIERRQNAIELEDTNKALNILLKKRERDNKELKQKLYANYESIVGPFLVKLRKSLSDSQQHSLLDILEKSLNDIFSPFIKKLIDPLILLTPSEIQIATMVRQGLSNKEIAQTLNCSVRTIETHRAHIRKKIDLTNKKINLKSYFSTL